MKTYIDNVGSAELSNRPIDFIDLITYIVWVFTKLTPIPAGVPFCAPIGVIQETLPLKFRRL